VTTIEPVFAGLRAFREGDTAALLRQFHPDIEISDPERAGGPFRGHDALLAWSADWMENWDEYEMELLAPVVTQDSVVALVHHKGRARASGIEFDQLGAQHYRVRDGLIVYWRPYTDRGEALAAAGLQDPDQWLRAIDMLRAGYDAWNRRDFEALATFLTDDMEIVPVLDLPDMPPFTGRESAERFWESSLTTWETFVFTPLAFEPHGDQLLVEVRANARARGSGIELEQHMAHLYTLRDGELVRLQAFTSTEEARESLAYPERR
jgi:ketosteroid isomerase-like protein